MPAWRLRLPCRATPWYTWGRGARRKRGCARVRCNAWKRPLASRLCVSVQFPAWLGSRSEERNLGAARSVLRQFPKVCNAKLIDKLGAVSVPSGKWAPYYIRGASAVAILLFSLSALGQDVTPQP